MSARPSTQMMRNALKLATKSALFAAGGAAALVREKMVRVGEAALSFASSPNDDHVDRFVGLDVALDLDFLAGEPHHARALAAPQGYELRRIEPQKPNGIFCLNDVQRLAREYHDVQDCMFRALDDNVVSPSERVAMLAELSELDRVSAEIRAKIEASA